MIQGCKNPIAGGDFKWIFACNCEGTEQLQKDITIQQVCAFAAQAVRK